jgi:2-haloacid dehalogenase
MATRIIGSRPGHANAAFWYLVYSGDRAGGAVLYRGTDTAPADTIPETATASSTTSTDAVNPTSSRRGGTATWDRYPVGRARNLINTGRVSADFDAVVFDLGGVLIDWNPRHLYRQLFDDEAEMEHFLATVCTLEWHVAHDLGESTADSCAELARRHPEHAPMITAWAERSEDMIGGAIDGTVAILEDLLDAGVPCYVLSNMEPETFPVRRERFEFIDRFHGHVISGLEGLVKPDPRIFRRLLRRFDLQPTRTVFIDDSAVNVEAATELGIRAIHFSSPERLRADLEALGLL